jgi:hypothetical protein
VTSCRFVPGYSGGPVPDLHRVPFSSAHIVICRGHLKTDDTLVKGSREVKGGISRTSLLMVKRATEKIRLGSVVVTKPASIKKPSQQDGFIEKKARSSAPL